MGHAIQLNFDKSTTAKIKKIWTSLKYHNICDFMVDHSVEPHLTLFVYNQPINHIEEELITVVNDFFAKEVMVDVEISNVGVLSNDANIIILNVVITQRLLDLHKRLYDNLVAKGFEKDIIEKCLPDKWMPYITMTMNVNETDMIDAVKLLKRKFKPLKATVASASLLGFYPIVYKSNKELVQK